MTEHKDHAKVYIYKDDWRKIRVYAAQNDMSGIAALRVLLAKALEEVK